MSKTRGRGYTIKFAALLCFVCCMLITVTSSGLKRFQVENMEVDRQKNILKAAGVIHDDDTPKKDRIKTLFMDTILEVSAGPDGRIHSPPLKEEGLTLYLRKEGEHISAYIIPIESRGLWGKILGYMAFEPDGTTVTGFSIYSHSETPGLGGEIEKQWFRKNFVGKKIFDQNDMFVSVGIAKGSVDSLPSDQKDNYVDGISGATLTGKYLSQGIKKNLERYETVSIKLRQVKAK